MAKAQQKLSRKKKCSRNYRRQKRRVALVHERVELRSRHYVDNYDLIAFEDLNIKGLIEINGSPMRKLMLDASWGKFVNFCVYKAESAGKRTVQVDPNGTSQECSVCGEMVWKNLSERTHKCPFCGAVMPRDYNSARNVKLRGLKMVRWGTPEPSSPSMESGTLAEIETSVLGNEPKQVLVEEARIPRF